MTFLYACKRVYSRTGINTASSGTFLYYIHQLARAVYSKAILIARHLRLTRGVPLEETTPESLSWYKITTPHSKKTLSPSRLEMHFRTILQDEEHAVFDLDFGIRECRAKGIALVFFMGMGDYIFTTPLLAALRRRHPGVPIYGYVSSNQDVNNAPLVAELMRHNPNIDKVFAYTGAPAPMYWKNYNYKEVFKLAPADFLVAPLIYKSEVAVRHRITTLFETFSLPRPSKLPLPILHLPQTPGESVVRLMEDIRRSYQDLNRVGVVFIHMDARSSNYSYPYVDALAENLCQSGYLVVSASKTRYRGKACFELDLKKFSITDSMYLLKLLKNEYGSRLSLLTVVSVFWAVSSALQIRNVGIQQYVDLKVHSVWYPNIHVITHHDYPSIPEERLFLAQAADYSLNNYQYADFKPAFVLECFREALLRDSTAEGLKEQSIMIYSERSESAA